MAVLATIIGLRREDASRHSPQTVELRLRPENGPFPASLDPSKIQLLTESLVPLGPPTILPSQQITLAPNQQSSLLALFPLPPGSSDATLDLNGLRLSIPITINDHPVQAAINFQRITPYYYYDYDYYPYYTPYYGPYFYPYPTFYGRFYFHSGGHFHR